MQLVRSTEQATAEVTDYVRCRSGDGVMLGCDLITLGIPNPGLRLAFFVGVLPS